MEHILDYSWRQLRDWFISKGQPGYRVAQVLRWVYDSPKVPFDEMSDVPKVVRKDLRKAFKVFTMQVVSHRKASDGTEKLLLRTQDGEYIECVLLRDDKGNRTVCISTQVGCGMGCVFCASGLDGVVRNLTSGEILEQILHLKCLLEPDERLSHIVVMGMGEPLANLGRLLGALYRATHKDGLGISARHVTISTVGLPHAIRRLAELDLQYHLAVSLHAPNDELRNQLVPANRRIGIQAILSAADEYFAKTGRRVTYEYVLLREINDRPQHAQELAQLLKGRNALVNLIPYNPIQGLPYEPPERRDVARFVDVLDRAGIQVTVRYRKGAEIEAACGQLRRLHPEIVSKSKKKKKKKSKSAEESAVQASESAAVVSGEGGSGQAEGAFNDSVVMSGDPTVVVTDAEILNFEEIAEPETTKSKRDSE
ncbi:23S rRNA (adenine(2503)-C(2))-methyltransferase RlmN [Thermogutta sp.]|uniref:23S rRNA (adenine(2503)-C(2))-methyltransferase RlmN n=1 Tax=Thermogutta sp. TaxID=1962930 RepID=UPI0032204AFD